MKKLVIMSAILGAILLLAGCSGGEEPYVIEGKGMNDPSVAGAVSSDGSGGVPQEMAKPSAPAARTKAGR